MRSLVLFVFLVGCTAPASELPPPPATSGSSIKSPWVAVRSVAELGLLEAPAQVTLSSQAQGAVTPPLPGRVMRVFVRPGERVERGAAIVDVTMPQLVAAAGAYLAAHTRYEAYTRRKAQLDGLRQEGLVKLSELSEVETRLAEARADEQTASASLRSAGIPLSQAQQIIAGDGVVTLRSPVRGVVVELQTALGETRDASRAIARIAGDGEPRIEARLAHAAPAGARFEFVAPDGTRYPVSLVSEAPFIDPRDGARLTWFEPAAGTRLAGGMNGKLRVLLATEAGAVTVPAASVQRAPAGALVFVRDGQGRRAVAVTVLGASGADALVSGKLKVGDEVVGDATGINATDGGAR